MNNYPNFFNPNLIPMPENFNNISSQLNYIKQEIERLNRRLLNLEKNSIENNNLYNINPTQMIQNKIEAINNLYSKDNYMI